MAQPRKIPQQIVPQPQNAVSAEEDTPASKERSTEERLTDEDIEDRKADRALRRDYARNACWLVVGILSFWAIIVLGVAIWSGCTGGRVRPLSDTVLIAITTGATANVFAAFLSVIRGLFPSKQSR